MPKVTRKGQITIPKHIRSKFGFTPGTDVEIVTEKEKAVIRRKASTEVFFNWLGRSKGRSKEEADALVNQLRGRAPE